MAWPSNDPPPDVPVARVRDVVAEIEHALTRAEVGDLLPYHLLYGDGSVPLAMWEPYRARMLAAKRAALIPAGEINRRLIERFFRLRDNGMDVEQALAQVATDFLKTEDQANTIIRRNPKLHADAIRKFSGRRRRRRRAKTGISGRSVSQPRRRK